MALLDRREQIEMKRIPVRLPADVLQLQIRAVPQPRKERGRC